MSRSYKQHDLKLLFTFAGNQCAFPICKSELAVPATPADGAAVLANIAHIVAHSDEGPRGDPSFPQVDREKYENLILLCATHHMLVDLQPNTFTCEDLRSWKQQHELWVHERIFESMDSLNFAELQVTCARISAMETVPSTAPIAIPISEKIDRNELAGEAENYLKIGLTRAPLVADFLEKMSSLDSDFPQRLRAGFVSKFSELKGSCYDNNQIFLEMVSWTAAALDNSTNVIIRIGSGVAVLAHLFELCEVFPA